MGAPNPALQVWQKLAEEQEMQLGTTDGLQVIQLPPANVLGDGQVQELPFWTNPLLVGQVHVVLILLGTKFVPHVAQVVRVEHDVQPVILHRGLHRLEVS